MLPPKNIDFSLVSLEGFRADLEERIRRSLCEGRYPRCSEDPARIHLEGLCIALVQDGERCGITELSLVCRRRGAPNP